MPRTKTRRLSRGSAKTKKERGATRNMIFTAKVEKTLETRAQLQLNNSITADPLNLNPGSTPIRQLSAPKEVRSYDNNKISPPPPINEEELRRRLCVENLRKYNIFQKPGPVIPEFVD